MPAVSEAQRRLFSAVLTYKQHGGDAPQRVKNLANSMAEDKIKDFTVLAPGVKRSRAAFPQYSKGQTLSAAFKDTLKKQLGDKKYEPSHRLDMGAARKQELFDALAADHNVSFDARMLGKAKTLGNLQHALNNAHTLQKAAELLKRAHAPDPGAPTLSQLQEYYPGIGKLFQHKAVDIKQVSKNDVTKDVPVVSEYGELVDAAKAQHIGLIRRHLLAMATRPTVWQGNNAAFLPYGDNGVVVGAKKLNEDVVRHELGHAEDYIRLGGQKAFHKEYTPKWSASLRDKLLQRYLLPEARAWHYAGRSHDFSVDNPDRIRDRAFHSYVGHIDGLSPG